MSDNLSAILPTQPQRRLADKHMASEKPFFFND
jgi:hypothetical protein